METDAEKILNIVFEWVDDSFDYNLIGDIIIDKSFLTISELKQDLKDYVNFKINQI